MTDTAKNYDEDEDHAAGPGTDSRRRGLQPFRKGDGRAAAAGRKGVETRRANAAARATSARATADALAAVADRFRRDELGDQSAAVAGWLLGRIAAGAVPVRNAGEAADLLRALVDVARLEAGQATSTSLVAHIGPSATSEVLALRDKARAMLGTVSPAALAVDDSHDVDHGEDEDTGHGEDVDEDAGQ